MSLVAKPYYRFSLKDYDLSGFSQDLLNQDSSKGPIGRKMDFLTQEFNREANTLCSKAQSAELTAVGLDLKHVIDQMREQVQNIE